MLTNNTLEGFFEFEFENGQVITGKQLKAVYDDGHTFIHIDLTDTHFSPEITLFNGSELNPIRGGIIRIDNNSSMSTLVSIQKDNKPEVLKDGYYYHASGTRYWGIIVKPI